MLRYTIAATQRQSHIHREIYGNFSEHLGRCIYEGVYVGENSPIPNVNGLRTDVVQALRQLRLPVLRWPGGCFADEYHWKDGIGDPAKRKRMVNTHWGGVVEDNSFGTHEFLELCRQVDCLPYINGNVGSGTVQEMQEWVEYMTFDGVSPMAELRAKNGHPEPWRIPFFGVGNENWGCGGNMRPEYYADLYRRYQTYVRSFGENKIYKIACGPGTSLEDPGYQWTETLLKLAGAYMDGLSLHYYTVPGDSWQSKGSATQFDEAAYYTTLRKALFMHKLLEGHTALMDRYDPSGRIGLVVDEWGSWYDVEPGTNPGFLYQQNTMRDALIAGVTLNLFNKYARRVRMANIAQLANVLQAVVLTDGAQMVKTPTYHVFDLYKVHQGATLLDSHLACDCVGGNAAVPRVHESASVDENGMLHATLCNLSANEPVQIDVAVIGAHVTVRQAQALTGAMNAYNGFETGAAVAPQPLEGVKALADGANTRLTLELPPCSVALLSLQ